MSSPTRRADDVDGAAGMHLDVLDLSIEAGAPSLLDWSKTSSTSGEPPRVLSPRSAEACLMQGLDLSDLAYK
jgi:hypothetical protein